VRETHVHSVCRGIKLISPSDASEDFRISNFGKLFCIQIDEDWRHDVCGLVLRYDQNVLIYSLFMKLQNGLLYYSQPFHCPISVECLRLDCKVEYTNANQVIMPEYHNIWVQYTESDLDNTFHGHDQSFQYYTSAGLLRIRSSNLRSPCPLEIPYWSSLSGAKWLNNEYYILKLKNMQWWFEYSTTICMVGLIVLTGSSGLSNSLIRYILFLLEKLLNWHIWCKKMLHQLQSIAYGL